MEIQEGLTSPHMQQDPGEGSVDLIHQPVDSMGIHLLLDRRSGTIKAMGASKGATIQGDKP
jgi:hypothetical protein